MSWTLLTLILTGLSSAMAKTESPSAEVGVVEKSKNVVLVDDLRAPLVPVLAMPEESDRNCNVRIVIDGARVESVLPRRQCHPVFLAAVQEASADWALRAESRRGKPVKDSLSVDFELVEREGQILADAYIHAEDFVWGSAPPVGLHFTTAVKVLRKTDLVSLDTLQAARRSGAVECRANVEVAADATVSRVTVEHCPTAVAAEMSASLARWTWRPKTVDGSPVSGSMVINFVSGKGGAASSVATIRSPRGQEPIGGPIQPVLQGPGGR